MHSDNLRLNSVCLVMFCQNNLENLELYFSYFRSMSLPLRHLEAEKSNTKDKNRGSPVETSVFYDEKEDSHARLVRFLSSFFSF